MDFMLQKTMARLACDGMSFGSKRKGVNTLFGRSSEEEIPTITKKNIRTKVKRKRGVKSSRMETNLLAVSILGLGMLIGAAYAVGERRSVDRLNVAVSTPSIATALVSKPVRRDTVSKEDVTMVNVIPNRSGALSTTEPVIISIESEQEAPVLVMSEIEPKLNEADRANIEVLETKLRLVEEEKNQFDQEHLMLMGKLDKLVVQNRALSEQLLNIDRLRASLDKMK